MNSNKKFSRIITVVIILSMLLSNITAFAAEREITASGTYGEVNWTLYSDGELRLDGEGVIGKINTNSAIPWNKRKAEISKISIGKDVIYNNTSMLDDSYTSLTEISVDEGNNSLTSDENGILYNYDKTILILFPIAINMSEYTIPDTVTQLADGSFRKSKIKRIIMGESIKKIGNYTFANCENLTEIIMSTNNMSFGRNAFSGCSSLENFVLPEGSDSVSLGMFSGCENLKKVVLHNKLTTINQSAFENCSKLSEIEIPESVNTIGRYTFQNCTSLKSISIPSKVTKIDFSVFSGCTNLNELTIGEGVKKVESDSFNSCESIERIDVKANISAEDLIDIIGHSKKLKQITISDKNESLSCDENGVIFNKDKTELICYPSGKVNSEYAVPDTVKRIGKTAFRYATALKNIKIPQSVEFIGASAFADTGYYLDYANWDHGFLYIGNNLVAVDKNKVSSVCTLFSKTRLIASNVFYNFTSIESISMPDSVEYINDGAFYGCSKTEFSNLPANLKEIGNSAFRGCVLLGENKVEIPSSVICIGDNAFYGCNLKNIIINEGLQAIGSNAFANNYELTEINIPRTVTDLDDNSFTSSSIKDIYYADTKAEWKRLASEVKVENITVHYTLRNTDDSVLIQHTDKNFIWEAGNVHLEVSEVTPASPTYDRNGYYNKNMISPIKVLDIRIVDGDGNSIQPLSDENITVKIKAPNEFVNMVSALLSYGDEVDFKTVRFNNGVFSYEKNGETVTVSLPEEKLNKLKIVHWFSDGTAPGDYEVFTHDKIGIENGYIILQTNHFSEYAVCTDMLQFEQTELEIENGKTAQLNVTVGEGDTVTYISSDENVAKVDSNGVVTAVGPGTATITATISGTGVSAKCTVNVPLRTFTVRWIVDGVTTEQKITEQSPLTAPVQMPEKDGHVFKGWSPEIPDTMPAKDITFTAVFEPIQAEKIEIITAPTKTSYTYKFGGIDLSGIEILVTYSDGSTETVTDTSEMTVSGFNNAKTGNQIITVEYNGATDNFNVSVSYTWWQWLIRILFFGIFWY